MPFDYQIGGAYRPGSAVRLVFRDRHDDPVPGRYSVCYVNAYQTQAEDDGWWEANHPDLLLSDDGDHVEDPHWAGEILLDTSTESSRRAIASILGGWFAQCAETGFQAVDPDNLDSWTRSRGLLTRADNVALARLVVADAHTRGLAIGQKNAPSLAGLGRNDIGFDFAVAEECVVHDECDAYRDAYGASVYDIEYTDNPISYYRRGCAASHGRIPIILRDHDLAPAGSPDHHYEGC